jgi:hypothetical protein
VTTVEERYAEMEAAAEERRRISARRQPLILLAVLNVLILFTALTAALDLRRLRTPEGRALAWTQAAVFGDCDDYFEFSVPDRTQVDQRTPEQVCRQLRTSTTKAREESSEIGLRLGRTLSTAYGVDVEIVLTRDEQATTLLVPLVRDQGHWRVVRETRICGPLRCP